MKYRIMGALVFALLCSCQSTKQAPERRIDLISVGMSTVQLIPRANQPPYCLVFSVSEKGVVRQLTITDERVSVECPAGKPIGNVTFRLPPNEGKVRLYTIMSDRPLPSGPMATQFHDLVEENPNFRAMDLRAPGQVSIETIEYTPVEGPEPEVVMGSTVTDDGGLAPPDAGAPQK